MDNFFVVDCEATGPCPGKGELTEFGAVHCTTRQTFHGVLFESEPDPEPHRPSYSASSETAHPSLPEPEGTVAAGKKVEYPEPLAAESADALPYGSDFHAAEGDSQPSFRTAEAAAPVAAAAHGTIDHAGSDGHPLASADRKV